MAIEVEKYDESSRNLWNEFILNSNNGTIFHLLDFLEYHGDKFKKNENHLIFREKGNIISVLPAAIFTEDSTKTLLSPYGASWGGFVIPMKITLKKSFELAKTFLNYMGENDIDRIELTLPPLIYYKSPHGYIDFALLKHGFEYKKREITSVVKVTNEPFNVFKQQARTATRKAKKLNINVFESKNFEAFYGILIENQKVRHDAVPTHTLNELLWLKDRMPNKFKLFLASLNDKLIAGVLLFICSDITPLAFYIAHNPKFQKYRCINLLIYEIIKFASSEGYKYLDLGTSTVNMNPNWNLLSFKESIGGVGYFRNTFSYETK